MRALTIIGVLILGLGIAALVIQRIPYTDRDKLELGPIQVVAKRDKSQPIHPAIGVGAIVLGVIMIVAGIKSTPRN